MNMYEIEGLPIRQFDAPEAFTQEVMKKVRAIEPKESSSSRNMRRTGLILIAASLITLFIGLTPIMDMLENTISKADITGRHSSLTIIAENTDSLTEKISNLLSRPVDFISHAINKEE